MSIYLFTFGQGHVHPKTGEPLDHRFVRIEAPDEVSARLEMVRRFLKKWCGCYVATARASAEEQAGVARWDLSPLEGELALGLLGSGPTATAMERLRDGPMKKALLTQDPAFAEEMARDYLDADDDTKSDIEDFFACDGPRKIHQARLRIEQGTPTSDDLAAWLGDL